MLTMNANNTAAATTAYRPESRRALLRRAVRLGASVLFGGFGTQIPETIPTCARDSETFGKEEERSGTE